MCTLTCTDERETNRQTDRQRQRDRRDRQTDRNRDKQRGRHTERHTERHADRDRNRDKETHTEAERRREFVSNGLNHIAATAKRLELISETNVHSTTTRSRLFPLELFSKILGFSCKPQRITASILVFRIQKQKSEFWSRQRRAIHKWAVFVGRSACRHWQHADTSAQIEVWLSMALRVFNLA